ncbi:MAG: GTP-binding protein [Candidatus Lokiarchaeota archaeon]|nr:GTP-binding protein [Candidatus Lokiarchaeota archaeon]MBD3339498.1 GTP-binding protein [Candidatus Lokiarchaeota archaeon]
MEFRIKLVVIGDPGVGKTSLVRRFISDHFSSDYRASIGTTIYTKKLTLSIESSTVDVVLQIWDIAGQERWAQMRDAYYMGSHGALIVGDLTRKHTFEQIENFWVPDLLKNCDKVYMLLLANKKDLETRIELDLLKDLKKRISASSFFLTSAKENQKVEEAFEFISKEIITGFTNK